MSGFPHAENVPGSDVGASKVTCRSTRTCARPATQATHTNPRRASACLAPAVLTYSDQIDPHKMRDLDSPPVQHAIGRLGICRRFPYCRVIRFTSLFQRLWFPLPSTHTTRTPERLSAYQSLLSVGEVPRPHAASWPWASPCAASASSASHVRLSTMYESFDATMYDYLPSCHAAQFYLPRMTLVMADRAGLRTK